MTSETGATGKPGTAGARGAVACGYCGQVFAEDRGQAACRACPLGSACRYVRCPSCGYENPIAPAWLAGLKRWMAGDDGR